MIEHITDHFEQARERLIWQWSGKKNLELVLETVMREVQSVEDTLWQMLELNADNATGVNLDVIGIIVGQERAGRVDTDYRKLVKVRIAVNKSHGKRLDLRSVALALFGAGLFRFTYSPPHSIQVEARTDSFSYLPTLEKELLESAADGVTRVDIHFVATDDAFRWGTTDTFDDDSAHGFASGDDFDSGSGGLMAGEI